MTKNKPLTHEKVSCPVCRKVCAGIIPKNGDGSGLMVYKHVSAMDGYTNPCEGSFMIVDTIPYFPTSDGLERERWKQIMSRK